MAQYRRLDDEAWQRRKEYLIRSSFHDSQCLSTITEEGDDSATVTSPPLCPSPEPHRPYSPRPPPAHRDGLWSPLPPLVIEKEPKINKHDESEEYYKRLERKILKIYRRIFFENRSDISDINTDDDDDTPINNEPIDYSTNRDKSLESTHRSIIDLTADEGNNKQIIAAGTENQHLNEEIEQFNEPSDDENINENHDDDDNDNDNDNNNLRNLEDVIGSDDGQVSSSTDIIAKSTESDGIRDSDTPLSSTVVLSRGTSDEEIRMERNEVSAKDPHHIDPEDANIEESRPSKPRLLTGSIPGAEDNSAEEDVDMENMGMETDNINEEIEESGTPADHDVASKDKDNMAIDTDNINEESGTPADHDGASKDRDNMAIDTDHSIRSEIEEMRTPRPHRASGSPVQRNVHPIEPNVIIIERRASMESERYSTNGEEIPTRFPMVLLRNNTIENPDNIDLFDLLRISSPKEMQIGDKTRIADPEDENISPEDNRENISPRERREHISPADNGQNVSPKDKRENIFPRDRREHVSPEDSRQNISPKDNRENISPRERREHISPEDNRQNISFKDNRENISPKESREHISPEDNGQNISPKDNRENVSSRNSRENISRGERRDNISPEDSRKNITPGDNINFPGENNRKRKSVNCPCSCKRVKLESKCVQTDLLNRNQVLQTIYININPNKQ